MAKMFGFELLNKPKRANLMKRSFILAYMALTLLVMIFLCACASTDDNVVIPEDLGKHAPAPEDIEQDAALAEEGKEFEEVADDNEFIVFENAPLEAGQLLSFGSNEFGQLGHGSHSNLNRSTKIEGLTNIVGIAAGSNHSLLIQKPGN